MAKLGRPRTRAASKDNLILAAIACFRRLGFEKATIDDVAIEAGVGRQTIYRAFRTRERLNEAVVAHFAGAMLGKIARLLARADNFADGLVAGSVRSIRLVRAERTLMTILESRDRGLNGYYAVGRDTPLFVNFLAVWGPLFQDARRRGELRPGLADEDIAEWLLSVHLILLVRADLTRAAQERLLRTMVIPALAQPAKAKR